MKYLLNLIFLFLLGSCAKIEATGIPITLSPTPIPINTQSPPPILPTRIPVTLTLTAQFHCDPSSADYCISEGHFIFQRPIHLPANERLDETYLYGSTANGTREPHHGVEFPNPSGTPVYAAADGTVVFAGPDGEAVYCPWPNFYGNLVVLSHRNDFFTLYAHLSKIDVEAGQAVTAGTQIGEVGRTGVAIGSHLHFEVRQGDVEDYFATQDPQLWLVPAKSPQGEPFGTLSISVMDEAHKLVKYAKYTISFSPGPSQASISYYGTTYSADMLKGNQNAVLGELPGGRYRIAIERYGVFYERWVEVESGKLTQVVFVVK